MIYTYTGNLLKYKMVPIYDALRTGQEFIGCPLKYYNLFSKETCFRVNNCIYMGNQVA